MSGEREPEFDVMELPNEPDAQAIERYMNTPWDQVHPGLWNALCVIASDWYEEAQRLRESPSLERDVVRAVRELYAARHVSDSFHRARLTALAEKQLKAAMALVCAPCSGECRLPGEHYR